MKIARRVVGRYLLSAGLERGRTWETRSVRVHRYDDHFKVTDLENAGKRGKKVRVMNISPTSVYKGDPRNWMESMSKAIVDYDTYDRIKALIKDILVDAPNEVLIEEREVRGVDVRPAGATKITLVTSTGIEITADPTEWSLKVTHDFTGPKGNKFTQDTLYFPVSKKDIAPFYNWLAANLTSADKMTIEDFRKLWNMLGVRYDYH